MFRSIGNLIGSSQKTSRTHGLESSYRAKGRLQELIDVVRVADEQLTNIEYGIISGMLIQLSPCNLLIFGQGSDSELWSWLNRAGSTVFLENCVEWFRQINHAESHLVTYPNLSVPERVSSQSWDLVFVDGPMGWKPEHPGRRESIKAASRLTTPGGWVVVHDYNRDAERRFCNEYLGNPTYEVDRLAFFHTRQADTNQ